MYENAWLVIAAGSSRTHAGNDGYLDVLDDFYSWDSTVAHFRDILSGDRIVLRSKSKLIGSASIEKIETWSDRKLRNRCANRMCRSTKIKKRKTILPEYFCQVCKNQFDVPEIESIEITQYRAQYGTSFVHLTGLIDVRELREMSYYHAKCSHSMQPIKYEVFRDKLAKLGRLID